MSWEFQRRLEQPVLFRVIKSPADLIHRSSTSPINTAIGWAIFIVPLLMIGVCYNRVYRNIGQHNKNVIHSLQEAHKFGIYPDEQNHEAGVSEYTWDVVSRVIK